MHLILMVHSSNSECNGNCDYAVVELTPALVEQIRSRAALVRQAARQDRNLDEISFWGGRANFYSSELADAYREAVAANAASTEADAAATDWLADMENRGYAVVPQGVNLGKFEAHRTECDRMIVSTAIGDRDDCEISWKSVPKHTDIYVTTWELPLSVIEELLATPPCPRPTGIMPIDDAEPNVPCIACSRDDLPLHINRRCGACGPSPSTDDQTGPDIRLPCFGITICLDRRPSANEPASGTITSVLKQDTTGDDAEYFAAIDGLESLILAHACAGIDVTTPAYIEGIETAVAAIAHNF
jgi:hypothetical protein